MKQTKRRSPKSPPSLLMEQIVDVVKSITGLSERTIREDVKSLGIKPLGNVRQRPRRYSANVPDLIVINRGYQTALLPPADTALSALNRVSKKRGETRRQKESRIASAFGIKYGGAK